MGGFSSTIQQSQPSNSNNGKGLGGAPTATQPSTQPNSIDSLYQNVLGRAPDQGGANYWSQQFGDTIEPNEIETFRSAAQAELANRSPAEQAALAPKLMGQPQSMPSSPTGGKGASGVNSYPAPQGMQGRSTNSATSGQPMMGAPNQYSNTVGQWDNSQIQPVRQGGKGKGV